MKNDKTRHAFLQISMLVSDRLTSQLRWYVREGKGQGFADSVLQPIISSGAISAWAATMRDLGASNADLGRILRDFAATLEALPEHSEVQS